MFKNLNTEIEKSELCLKNLNTEIEKSELCLKNLNTEIEKSEPTVFAQISQSQY